MSSKKENNKINYNSLLKGFKNRKDLLYLFSMYIASNPDFKYNYTYLTDSIDPFLKDYAEFVAKRLVFLEIIDYVKIQTKDKYDIDVVFNSIFRFNILRSIDIEVVSDDNSYQFDQMGNKSFIVKFILHKTKDIEYQFEIEKYDYEHEWKTKIDSFINIIIKKYNEK